MPYGLRLSLLAAQSTLKTLSLMIMSGKEFPNNWQNIYDADEEDFGTCTFEEFSQMMQLWALPSSIACIMRIENKDTGKIKELTYKRTSAASNKIVELVDDPANVITIMDDATIHHLVHPKFRK
jgi:hypothetical protein